LNAFDIVGASEVVLVFGFLEPAALSVGFAGVAAVGLGTEALTGHIAVVGMENPLAVLTVRLLSRVCHGPESPQAHDLLVAVGKEENRDTNGKGRRRKKTEEGD
jgi:hypothetical protein